MSKLDINSPAVQGYVDVLQNVINRMAANSANCKTWCIGIVSAIIVVSLEKTNSHYIWVALVPITLLCLLDAYYLGWEKKFRSRYEHFIEKLHSETAEEKDLFHVKAVSDIPCVICATGQAIFSLSVLPFYLTLGLMVFALHAWL